MLTDVLATLEKEKKSTQMLLTASSAIAPGGPDGPGGPDAGVPLEDGIAEPASADTDPDDDQAKTKARWRNFAAQVVEQQVELVVEPGQQSLLRNLLRESKAVKATGTENDFLLWVYDTKMCGEAKSRPNVRLPPVREDHLAKLIGGALRVQFGTGGPGGPGAASSVQPPAAIQPKDIYLILDGGRTEVEKPFSLCFSGDDGRVMQRARRVVYLTHTEEAPHRRHMLRGFASINQVERMLVLTARTLSLQERQRLHYKGTNKGNSIGDIAQDTSVTPFLATRAEKAIIYGPHNLLSVGGPGGSGGGLREVDTQDVDASDGLELDSDLCHVFYHTMPLSFYEEIIHSFCARGVVHLTAGNGELALACLNRKVPYVGVCFSEQHVSALQEYLVTRVYQAMQSEVHPLYQATMVMQLASSRSTADPGAGGPGGPDAQTAAGARASAKAKAKAKAEAKAAANPKAAAGKAKAKAKARAKALAVDDALAAAMRSLEEGNAEEEAGADDPGEGDDGEGESW